MDLFDVIMFSGIGVCSVALILLFIYRITKDRKYRKEHPDLGSGKKFKSKQKTLAQMADESLSSLPENRTVFVEGSDKDHVQVMSVGKSIEESSKEAEAERAAAEENQKSIIASSQVKKEVVQEIPNAVADKEIAQSVREVADRVNTLSTELEEQEKRVLEAREQLSVEQNAQALAKEAKEIANHVNKKLEENKIVEKIEPVKQLEVVSKDTNAVKSEYNFVSSALTLPTSETNASLEKDRAKLLAGEQAYLVSDESFVKPSIYVLFSSSGDAKFMINIYGMDCECDNGDSLALMAGDTIIPYKDIYIQEENAQ